MIWLDPRMGSGELAPYFKPYDVDVLVHQLEFADACWAGSGPVGQQFIGIERKVIGDLISSMRSNRLSGHQLKGLLDTYEKVYLLVEGVWKCGKGNEIIVPVRGGWMPLRIGNRHILYAEVAHYLTSLSECCGLEIVRTSDKEQTAAWIVECYRWWQKDYAKHDSWRAIYAPVEERINSRRGRFTMPTVGPVEMVAAQLPGVQKKAWEVGKRFKTVEAMVSAGVKEWEEVEGIGKKGAQKIWNWFRGVM